MISPFSSFASVILACVLVTGCQPRPAERVRIEPTRFVRVEGESGTLVHLDSAQLAETVVRAKRLRARIRQRRTDLDQARFAEAFDADEEIVVVGSPGPDALAVNEVSAVAFSSENLAAVGFVPNLEIADGNTITNNQESGVDEGDIVKRAGRFLIVLRRGRLHSFDLGRGSSRRLRLVDSEPVYPYRGEHQAWYDEILVAQRRLIVLGYAYVNSATELSVFEIDDRGRLDHDETYVLRSNDYYSRENYGARLVGGRLILQLSVPVEQASQSSASDWFSYTTLGRRGKERQWRPLLGTVELVASRAQGLVDSMHLIVSCDFATRVLGCRARGMLGQWEEEHYVTPEAAYVWTRLGPRSRSAPWRTPEAFERWLSGLDDVAIDAFSDVGDEGVVYRVPFDEREPIGRIRVSGTPINQFAFRERDAHLELLVSRSRARRGDVQRRQWVRFALDRFGEDDAAAGPEEVVELPSVFSSGWCRGNRFVGSTLLYSCCRSNDEGQSINGVYAIGLDHGARATWIETSGPTTRIERVGDGAVVVSESREKWPEGGLELRALTLTETPTVTAQMQLDHEFEIETRSHGFNWTAGPTARAIGAAAVLGLPSNRVDPATARPHRFGRGRWSWVETIYDSENGVRFFSLSESGALSRVGALNEELVSGAAEEDEEECEASCFDFYGSVRPFFIDGRVFALLGGELAEARFADGRLEEIRRVRFATR